MLEYWNKGKLEGWISDFQHSNFSYFRLFIFPILNFFEKL